MGDSASNMDLETSMGHSSATSMEVEKKISMQACNVLNEMRKQGQLCDAVLVVEDGNFQVHRAIMSSCSPYFRALFTSGMHETEQREILIPGVPADMMSAIIDFAYTREINVHSENVERLLPVADQFHVLGLVKECCQFLTRSLSIDNCIGIRNFARNYFCRGLERSAHRFILEHFVEIAQKSNEILWLSPQELTDIISSDELNVKNEEIVFGTICRWISHEPESRKPLIKQLLQCMRLGLLTTQYFVETVKKHSYVSDNEECRPLVIDTLKFLYDLDMDEAKEVDLNHPLARPRVPHEVMFAVGGWSGGSPTNIIETYDTRADRWIMIDKAYSDIGPRAYHGCASVDGLIYLVGGFDGVDYFNNVRCYCPVTRNWTEVAPMNSRRCYVSVAVLKGCIYALGGFDGHLRQNTAERYQPRHNQWSLVAPMHHQRSDASATTLDDKVYITGGFNGQECLNSAECYDATTNQWTLLSSMRNRRSGVGVIAHSGYVYALGGFNGITRMNHGERFNPITNTWGPISEMYSPRSNFGVEVLDDMIFAIGGFNGVTTIYNVECFDPNTDEWYDCTDMNIYRSALSVCVVKGLPNVKDYIHKDRSKAEEKKKRNA